MSFFSDKKPDLAMITVPDEYTFSQEETGFMENFDAAYEEVRFLDRHMAEQALWEDKLQKRRETILDLTGKDLPVEYTATDFMDYRSGQREMERPTISGVRNAAIATRNSAFQRAAEIEDQIDQLRESLPSDKKAMIKTRAELWEDIKGEALQAEDRSREVSDNSTMMGSVGYFVGGAASSMTFDDPLNIITMGFGGAGKSILARSLSQAGVTGVSESINQFTGVQAWRESLGAEHGLKQAAMNIAFAAGGAGTIQAGMEGAGKLIGRALSRPGVRDAVGLSADEELATALNYLSDKELLETSKEFIKEPTADQRAAIESLEAQEATREINPFEDSDYGEGIHRERLQKAVEDVAEGKLPDMEDTPPLRKSGALPDEISDAQSRSISRNMDSINADNFNRIVDDMLAEGLEDVPTTFSPISDAELDLLRRGPRINAKSIFQRIRELGGIKPNSLTQIERENLASAGKKISDYDGDLKRLFDTPGLRLALARKDGQGLDDLARSLADEGYIPGKVGYDPDGTGREATPDDLLEILEASGGGKDVYSRNDLEIVQEADDLANYRQHLEDRGIDFKEMDNATINKKLMEFEEGVPAQRDRPIPPIEAYQDIIDMQKALAPDEALEISDVMGKNFDADSDRMIADLRTTIETDDIEIPVDIRLDEDGNISAQTMKASELLDDLEQDQALQEAVKVCAL